MASSIFGPKNGGNTALQALNQLKGVAGGDFNAACSFLDNAGMTCTLPNGQQVNASQFAQMMRGKTPEQGFQEMGLDMNQAQSFLR